MSINILKLYNYDDEFNEPLEIYGGPKDAPFTWQLIDDGHVVLTDPNTGATVSSARTRSDFDIMLFHDTKDDVVPVDNFYAMSKFLKDNGIKTEEFVDEYSSELIKELGATNHETSALSFFLKIIDWIGANYE